jgi:hypothetical protein
VRTQTEVHCVSMHNDFPAPRPSARRPGRCGCTRSNTTASECSCVRDAAGVRLFTRNGHDWTGRFPLIARAALSLKAASCLLDGEAVACDDNELARSGRIGSSSPSKRPMGSGCAKRCRSD